jgi:hypothetical protein
MPRSPITTVASGVCVNTVSFAGSIGGSTTRVYGERFDRNLHLRAAGCVTGLDHH